MSKLLEAKHIHKSYVTRAEELRVLRGANIEIETGEVVSILGESGSGKSTLLHILGLIDVPDKGEVLLEGKLINPPTNADQNSLRNRSFGFVFQFYHLLPEFTALENMIVPAMVGQTPLGWRAEKKEVTARARELFKELGLAGREHHRPNQLSGGEQQRVAIGRALINTPAVLFADEPTGNLDTATSRSILNLLLEVNRRHKTAMVIVTHNPQIAERTGRVVWLKNGVIAAKE
jgi:lipoprotein-releasing system ATP-binding protein